jgi:hypothetical protein
LDRILISPPLSLAALPLVGRALLHNLSARLSLGSLGDAPLRLCVAAVCGRSAWPHAITRWTHLPRICRPQGAWTTTSLRRRHGEPRVFRSLLGSFLRRPRPRFTRTSLKPWARPSIWAARNVSSDSCFSQHLLLAAAACRHGALPLSRHRCIRLFGPRSGAGKCARARTWHAVRNAGCESDTAQMPDISAPAVRR